MSNLAFQPPHPPLRVNRRTFLRFGGASLAAGLAANLTVPGLSFGATASGPQKTFVFVFMRGGADALNLFPPADDANYKALRPNIAVQSKSTSGPLAALDFAGQWQLHPQLAPLLQIPNLTASMSTALLADNRSHFDCQRWIENGTEIDGSVHDGIFNRYLQIQNPTGAVQGLAAGSASTPVSLAGGYATSAVGSLSSLALTNYDFCLSKCTGQEFENALATAVSGADTYGDGVAAAVAAERTLLQTIAIARSNNVKTTQTFSSYSQGVGLQTVAQLIKGGVPVSVAAIDWANDWDSHANLPYGAELLHTANPFNLHVTAGASDLLAFYNELGPDLMKNVVVLVGSEFGRCIQENGSYGADHGYGGVWFAFGGAVPQGHNILAGSDYTIAQAMAARTSKQSNYYIPMQIDHKDLIGEIMVRHLGLAQSALPRIFPNHSFTNRKLLG